MKKQIWKRIAAGIPIGITIGYLITLMISLLFGNGAYIAINPELALEYGSEINAVLVQTACWVMIGAVFGGLSMVWENDRWSLFVQSFVFCAIGGMTLLAAAVFCRWTELSVSGILFFAGLYLLIFFVIWLFEYWINLRQVRKLNLAMQTHKRK